jgi:hypothetical protein
MKRILFTVCLSFFGLLSFGQSSADLIVRHFFDLYEKNPNDAVNYIYGTTRWPPRLKNAITDIKTELATYTPGDMGKYDGYELVARDQLSTSLMVYTYLVKYDRQPVRFTFELYKPTDKWQLLSFFIDSNTEEELQ